VRQEISKQLCYLRSLFDAVCVDDSGGPRETPFAYSGRLRANTVLRSFNTIQPSSFRCNELPKEPFVRRGQGRTNPFAAARGD